MAKRGPKPKVSRAEIIEAALAEIDALGVAGLNMRSLSTRLGVSAMTPYGYFADKTELLDATVEFAMDVFTPPPATDGSWEERLSGVMHAMYDELVEHPGVLDLLMQRSEAASQAHARHDLLAVLEAEGFSRKAAFAAVRTLTSYVFGYAALVSLPGSSGRDTFDEGLAIILRGLE